MMFSKIDNVPMKPFHASPKFIDPRHRGDTLTPALGERIRWYPRTLFGFGAGSMVAVSVDGMRKSCLVEVNVKVIVEPPLNTEVEERLFIPTFLVATDCSALCVELYLTSSMPH